MQPLPPVRCFPSLFSLRNICFHVKEAILHHHHWLLQWPFVQLPGVAVSPLLCWCVYHVCPCFILRQFQVIALGVLLSVYFTAFGLLFVHWTQLMSQLDNIVLTSEPDVVHWGFEKSGKFATKSLYRQMCFGGVIHYRMKGNLESYNASESQDFPLASFA